MIRAWLLYVEWEPPKKGFPLRKQVITYFRVSTEAPPLYNLSTNCENGENALIHTENLFALKKCT